MFFFLVSTISKAQLPFNPYARYPVYNGNDLGLTWTPQRSIFRIWSPPAEKVELLLFNNVSDPSPRHMAMAPSSNGTWKLEIPGNLLGKGYTFRVMINGQWLDDVPDPYAKACGVNGRPALVIDPSSTHPTGWTTDKSPVFKNKTDAIIYELHIRDASIAANSGIKHKGKYLGLTETGTRNPGGLSTGLDHLKEMGVTHVHLLPFYDINSVDEKVKDKPQYNWGYDPLNYNIPEGSYATDATDGLTRIHEFKQLVKTFHANGLRVVMDVVYNHTALTEKSNFNQLVPGYYYRQTTDGKFSNATACGNETASERPMMRKFILESMMYWVKEYHIDGFRVDLMGVHDIQTMNEISRELHKIRPDILIYGEGWTAGPSPYPDSLRALKNNAYKLDRIAVFSDDIRDGIKGHVFTPKEKGFVSGKPGLEESIKFGVVASLQHPQVAYKKVNYSKAPYAAQPHHTITYAECHDNHVLWDRLAISATDATDEERINMHKLSLAIVLTSQGISFLHAGTEFLRSKKGVENSYESPDSINWLDWDLKTENREVVEFVKALIQMRKNHPAFRMSRASDIYNHIRFLTGMPAGSVGFIINGAAVGDKWKRIMVIFNGKEEQQTINLPTGKWKTYVSDNRVLPKTIIVKGAYQPKDYRAAIFYEDD
jgi:pullulanase